MTKIKVDDFKEVMANILGKCIDKLRGILPTGDLKTSKLARNEVYIVYKETDRLQVEQAYIATTEMQLDALLTYDDRGPKITGIRKAQLVERYDYKSPQQ